MSLNVYDMMDTSEYTVNKKGNATFLLFQNLLGYFGWHNIESVS